MGTGCWLRCCERLDDTEDLYTRRTFCNLCPAGRSAVKLPLKVIFQGRPLTHAHQSDLQRVPK